MTSEEALRWCEALDEVKAIGMFIEPGNALLKLLATGEVKPKKPTAVVIPGIALDVMPKGVPYGHTGTVVDDEGMSLHDLHVAIRNQGVACELSLNQFIAQCTSICPNQ
jgi:succinyl-CoA synthetase alpha subunit